MRRLLGKKVAGVLLTALVCAGGSFTSWAAAAVPAQTAAAQSQIEVSGSINSCKITEDKNKIEIIGSSSGAMTGTDGSLYLFELAPYENGIGGRTDYLEKVGGQSSMTFHVELNHNTAADRLYSSFALAVYDGTKFVQVSERHYITNPEIVAVNQKARVIPLTKKGLNIELSMFPDAMELGVKHVGINIAFHQIIGPGIDYVFEGKTYQFNKDVIASYDETISTFTGKDLMVTAIILNGWNPATPDLIRPGTQKSSNAFYYMFNVETEAGFQQTRAIAAFLAERYSGMNPNYGKISNWVIGNEINNQQWNYVGKLDLTSYVKMYQKAFRVFYTAIKSTSANDKVYFSLDHYWNHEIDGKSKYGGKNIVDSFNSVANVEGQMEWGLAYHPYPYPMVEPDFWDDDKTGLVTNDNMSPVINFKNLTVLTDYFSQESLKMPNGMNRSIILTEQGFTAQSASRGYQPQLQAAAFAYSYYIVDSNPMIDAYILSRQVDAPEEVRTGISFGLWTCDMNQQTHIIAQQRRKIWQVFKNIDKKNQTLENTEFAKEIIGIQKWSDVVPNFRWRSMEQ